MGMPGVSDTSPTFHAGFGQRADHIDPHRGGQRMRDFVELLRIVHGQLGMLAFQRPPP
jgi:hypothetical protein